MIFNWNRYGINYKEDIGETRVLKILKSHTNKWVSVWHIVMTAKTVHHTEMIRRLRKNYTIENKIEWKDKVMHSSYKLIEE